MADTKAPSTSATRLPYLLIAAAYSSLLAFGAADSSRSTLFPDIVRGLSLSDAAGSLLFTASAVGTILGSQLAPRALRSFGMVGTQRACLLIMALAVLGLAAVRGITDLLAVSFVFGTAAGMVAVTQNLLVEYAAPSAWRQRALSGLHSCYGLACLVAPLLVNLLRSMGWGWRAIAATFAVWPAIFAMLSLTARPDPMAPAPDKVDSGPLPPKAAWWLPAVASCGVMVELLVSTRITLRLERAGVSPEHAAYGLSAFFAGLFVSRAIMGVLHAPMKLKTLLGACLGAACCCYVLSWVHSPWWLVAVGVVIGPFFPSMVTLAAERFGKDLPRVLARIIACVSTSLAIANWLFGVVSDHWGIEHAMLLGVAIAALGMGLLLGERDTS